MLPQALQRLRELPSLVDVEIPDEEHFTVCGDVHGQFYDLLNIFKLNGLPSQQNPYLFNGAPWFNHSDALAFDFLSCSVKELDLPHSTRRICRSALALGLIWDM